MIGVPSTLVVGATQRTVTDDVVAADTMIVTTGDDVDTFPSLTLITTFGNVPTLAAAGVPESVPVVVSKVAQDGLPWML